MSTLNYSTMTEENYSDREWLMVQNHAKHVAILEKENEALKSEVEILQEGVNDLRMYNGDQEEMSNIFARLK